jgi:hypothetical protein
MHMHQGRIVRFFNPTQDPLQAHLQSKFQLTRAWRTDLAEIIRSQAALTPPDAYLEHDSLPRPVKEPPPDASHLTGIPPADIDAEAGRAAKLEAGWMEGLPGTK